MTDEQIIAYFTTTHTKTCGRFSSDQLNRNLTAATQKKSGWFKYFIQLLIPAMMVGIKSYAQGSVKTKPVVCNNEVKVDNLDRIILGGIAAEIEDKRIIGKVVDRNGIPIDGAIILIEGTKKGLLSNADGNFRVDNIKSFPVTLVISSPGFASMDIKVDKALARNLLTVVLDDMRMGDTLVTPHPKKKAHIFQELKKPVPDSSKALNIGRILGKPSLLVSSTEERDPAEVKINDLYMPDTRSIVGKVTNEDGEPLVGANIFIKDTEIGSAAGKDGLFEVTTKDLSAIRLMVSYVGYESVEISVTENQRTSPFNVVLKEKTMAEVTVVGYESIKCSMTLGAVITIVKDTIYEEAKRFIADTLQISPLKIIPNPIRKSSALTLQLKSKVNGKYMMLVTDMNGRYLQTEQFMVNSTIVQQQIRLKQSIAPGTYVVTIIDPIGKRLATQKIVVME
jgi:hypothetical protein